MEEQIGKNSDEEVTRRRKNFQKHQDEIWKVVNELPDTEEIKGILLSMDAPYSPAQLDVSPELLKQGIYFAKDLRNRFGLLQILFDFHMQEAFSNSLIDEFYQKTKRF